MRFETTENLQIYHHEINKYSQLTKEEEFELATRIQNSIGPSTTKVVKGRTVTVIPEPTDTEALHQLVQANLKFVVQQANRFIGQNVPIADLIMAGNLGMMEAAKRFDPAKGVRFITFAARYLQKYLNGEVDDTSKIVRIPKNQSYELYKKRKSGEDVNTRTVEIDKPISSDTENTLGDLILKTDPEIFAEMDTEETNTQVQVLMSILTEQEQQIVKLRFGFTGEDDLSNKEIAEKLNLPLPVVGRTMRTAYTKMRAKNLQLEKAGV
jgi:RNA polymerase primary sigma factor